MNDSQLARTADLGWRDFWFAFSDNKCWCLDPLKWKETPSITGRIVSARGDDHPRDFDAARHWFYFSQSLTQRFTAKRRAEK